MMVANVVVAVLEEVMLPSLFAIKRFSCAAVVLVAASLSACGGGSGGSSASGGSTDATASSSEFAALEAEAITATAQMVKVASTPLADIEVRRFLTQATFGPDEASVAALKASTLDAWLTSQMSAAMPTVSHQAYFDARDASAKAANASARAYAVEVANSFWRQALTEPGQLRQRVAFALSEIFVVSLADNCGADNPRSLANYMDMLQANAFGSYRVLLEKVALHPMMGCYLSHLRNQKENLSTGRVPDENFAREIMQLFSIGLYKLSPDGSAVLVGGVPVESYSASDVSGLAKVFTGWSWDCNESSLRDNCFLYGINSSDVAASGRDLRPMIGYPKFHSVSAKSFLGFSINEATPAADLGSALDKLSAHANVAPFISKQLIQRLVTSNPTPGYIYRVAKAFTSSNGNLGSTVRAILLDPEARSSTGLSSTTAGKVREPILKVTAMLRAMDATSDSGLYLLGETDSASGSLAQSPFKSPSVFNFFRPGYVPANSATSAAGLVAPEMQILHESSIAAYVNYMREAIEYGTGNWRTIGSVNRPDMQMEFQRKAEASTTLVGMEDASAAVELANLRLMYGTMPAELKSQIVTVLNTIDYRPKTGTATADQLYRTRRDRLKAALFLTVVSPEFQVQL